MKKIVMFLAVITLIVSFSGFAMAGDMVSNTNVAVPGVGQGQGQNQGIVINGPLLPPNPEQKDLTSVNNNGHGYRGFNNAAEIHYPGLPGYFGNATPGSSFQSCKTSLIYKDTFSVEELERMAKGFLGSKDIVTPLVDEVDDKDKAPSIQMLLRKPADGTDVQVLGYITVKATSNNTVSMEILAEAALKARDLGANAIHITAEGIERQLKAFGWGVGLSYTRASINNDETTGGVAAGGTGIAGGSAGYKDMPWFQVFALKIK